MRSSHLPIDQPIDQHLSIDPPSLPIDQHLIIDPPQEGMYRINPPQRISKNIWQRIANRLSPSISVGTVGLSTLTLVVCAVCISVMSEKLYRGTLDNFAKSAMNSVTTRLVIETTTTMRELESTLDTMVYSTHRANREVPSVEEAELARSGLIIPLGPSIANESSMPFSFNLGSQIPNTSLTVSTWRQFYGQQMAATAFASRNYFTNFDVVFTDGSFLSLELPMKNNIKVRATLLDGMLSGSYGNNTKEYYVRKTSTDSDLAFRQSSIVTSNFIDRRAESWLTQRTWSGSPNLDFPSRGWSELKFNATTGTAWLDLVAVLSTTTGSIGRSRLSYSVDMLTYIPEGIDVVPISLDLFIVSRKTGVIFDTPDFNDGPGNRRRSLQHVVVPSTYELTSNEQKANCQLTPSVLSNGTQVRTCRHTVSSYGNPMLQAAWEEMRNSWPSTFFEADSVFGVSGKLSYRAPIYKQFSWDGKKYFVSSTNVGFTTIYYPELVILVIVPESEVVGVLNDIVLMVIGVTVGITLFASILFAIGTRLIFKPLRDVASDMKHAKYLRDDKKEPPMPLSRWSEVRAIQESYRAMSHELKSLKAYIPENVREDVLWRATEEHQKGSDEANTNEGRIPQISNDVQLPMLSEGTMDLATEGGDIVEMTVIDPATIIGPLVPTDSTIIESDTSQANPLKQLVTATANIALTPPQPRESQQVYFHDTSLIDRYVTVVHLNILQFHSFAQNRHSPSLSKDFTEFITFIGAEAKRFGGVLEQFMGDKICVSFNATSKCDKHQIAACYFGYYVTTVANDTAMRYCYATPAKPTDGSTAEEITVDMRLYMCLTGLNCGIATGKAFTGPLGNAAIKRHVIISNAMSESAALERLCGKYAGCNVLVGEGMLKHIEGYLHYLVIDALCLPGSEGKPILLATIQGPILGPSADISVVIKWLSPNADDPLKYDLRMERPSVTSSLCPESKSTALALPVRDKNMYDQVNDGFRAVLQNNKVLAARMAVGSHAAAKTGAQSSPGQLMRENWAMMEWMAITICEFVASASGEENNSVASPAGGQGYVSANGKAYSPVNRDLLRVALDPI